MNDKPRMVEIGNPLELRYLLKYQCDLSVPMLTRIGEGRFIADAEEMRRWRSLRRPQDEVGALAHESTNEQGGAIESKDSATESPAPIMPSGHRGDCYRDMTDGIGYCDCDKAQGEQDG